jgi:predicted amidophosphoribosyltransferase
VALAPQNIWKAALRPLISLLYPPLCLHCGQKLTERQHYLCATCFSTLERVDPNYRCPFCFSELEALHQKICAECRQQKQPLHRVAAVFDSSGAVASLLSGLASNKPYLAKGIGGFLVMQWAHLNWARPDVIVPVSRSVRRTIRQGYDPNTLLAQEVGRLLQLPLAPVLSYDEYETPPFRLKGRLDDKAVLMVGDKTTLMQSAADSLMGGFPSHICGLALCRD